MVIMMNKKQRIWVLAGAVTTLIIAAFFLIKDSMYISNYPYLQLIQRPVVQSTMDQTLFLFVCCVAGAFLGSLIGKSHLGFWYIFLAPVLGLNLWLLLSKLIIIIGIPYTVFSVVILASLLLITLGISRRSVLKANGISAVDWLVILFCFFCISLLASSANFLVFSEDSHSYMGLGESLATYGKMNADIADVFSARSIITPAFFSPSVFFGFNNINGLVFLYGLSFVVSLAYVIYQDLLTSVKKRQALFVAAGVLAFLFVANLFTTISLFYFISNQMANVNLFFAIFFVFQSKKHNSDALLFLSVAFMLLFIWVRPESPLIAVVLLFFIINMSLKQNWTRVYIVTCLLAVLLWYARFFYTAGLDFNEGMFLTAKRAAMVMAAYVLLAVYMVLIPKLKWPKLIAVKDMLPFAVMIFVIFAFAFYDFDKLFVNIKMIFANTALIGVWGITILSLFAVLSMYYVFVKERDIWDKVLWSYFILLQKLIQSFYQWRPFILRSMM